MPDADFWCPLARLSIQSFGEGKIETVPVSFNTVVRADPRTGAQSVVLSARCCGRKCALYRGFGSFGRCGLARSLDPLAFFAWFCAWGVGLCLFLLYARGI